MIGRRPAWLSWLGWLGLYGLAAALVFWRLLPDLATHLPHAPAEPDLHSAVWMPWNVARQLAAGADPFLAPGVMWPEGMDLTLYLWNLGCPLLAAPLHALLPTVLAANLAVLGYATANGIAGHLLGARVGGSRAAAVATGLAATWGFAPLYELCSGRPEQGFLAPLILATLFFFELLAAPERWTPRLGLGLSMAAAAACYWFHPVLLSLGLLPVALLSLPRGEAWAKLRSVALAAGISLLASLPAMLPVLLALRAPDNPMERAVSGSFTAARLLADRVEQSGSLAGLLWPSLPAGYGTIDQAHPLTLVLLCVATLAWAPLRRRAGTWALLAIAGLLLALGPRLQLTPGQPGVDGLAMPFALLDALPGFARFWWPRRFGAVALLGMLGVLAAFVGAFRRPRQAWMIASCCALLLLAELHMLAPGGRAGIAGGATWPLPQPALWARLAEAPWSQPIIQIPLGELPSAQVLDQCFHRQPIFGTIVQGNPDLVPRTQLERLERLPFCLLGAQPGCPAGTPEPTPEELKALLAAEGFRWVILRPRLSPGGPAAQRWAPRRLGPPSHEEDGLLAWELGG